jgi:hypothetical protein
VAAGALALTTLSSVLPRCFPDLLLYRQPATPRKNTK